MRCLDCDQVFEAEDLEQIPAFRRTYRRRSASAETGVVTIPPHFWANDNSLIKFTMVIPGTKTISGSSGAVQGFS